MNASAHSSTTKFHIFYGHWLHSMSITRRRLRLEVISNYRLWKFDNDQIHEYIFKASQFDKLTVCVVDVTEMLNN